MGTDWDSSMWTETFNELQSDDSVLDYEDRWTLQFNYNTLEQSLSTEETRRGWKVFSHCAHGDFQCTTCMRTWTSARVVLLFHYRLRKHKGTVIMRPFGQACRHCKDDFYLPGFSEEEVEYTLERVFSKIRKNCYGEEDEEEDEREEDSRVSKPHEKALCEACRMGICCEN
ncbi:receptor-transporting protein 3-like [Pholidichthys leucotaenia]